jgi:hypothetical protein
MPYIEFHACLRENDRNRTADVTTVVGNENLRWRDVKLLAASFETIKKFADLSIRLAMTEPLIISR